MYIINFKNKTLSDLQLKYGKYIVRSLAEIKFQLE